MQTIAQHARQSVGRRPRERLWTEILFLVFLIALHGMPLVALATGHSWGTAAEGYGIAVVLISSMELAHELRGHPAHRAARGDAP